MADSDITIQIQVTQFFFILIMINVIDHEIPVCLTRLRHDIYGYCNREYDYKKKSIYTKDITSIYERVMLKKYLIVCPLKENVCFINLKLFAIAFFVQVYAKTFVKQLKNDDSCPTLLLKTTIY